ncbi:MAG: L-2-hydroxyglutarate oxidase [Chloroflexota bacterium]
MTQQFDAIIVGGGIVGLATARELALQNPKWSIAIIDKEPELATHQSGHNSGVIHAGIYYKTGSLKAKLCVAGRAAVVEYMEQKEIPYRLCGKLIVALDDSELDRLHDLYERGTSNSVPGLELVGPERMAEIEPCVVGVKGIWSPGTGVADWRRVALSYADDVRERGGHIITGCKLLELEQRSGKTILKTTRGDYEADLVITCAGLYSDRIAGERDETRIVPFRGSYYVLSDRAKEKVNGLIYPVPDPAFPFLGVHFTRTLQDEVWVGPNAVLAFAREGYDRWKVNPGELAETLTFPGFWKLATTYWQMGALEMYRDFVKAAYVKTAQAYIPTLTADDLLPGPAGVRAQALRRDGSMVQDFLIKHDGTVHHVQNAPSPAATSSLEIARYITREVNSA